MNTILTLVINTAQTYRFKIGNANNELEIQSVLLLVLVIWKALKEIEIMQNSASQTNSNGNSNFKDKKNPLTKKWLSLPPCPKLLVGQYLFLSLQAIISELRSLGVANWLTY